MSASRKPTTALEHTCNQNFIGQESKRSRPGDEPDSIHEAIFGRKTTRNQRRAQGREKPQRQHGDDCTHDERRNAQDTEDATAQNEAGEARPNGHAMSPKAERAQ